LKLQARPYADLIFPEQEELPLALRYNSYGAPENNPGKQFEYVADGLPSYDSAIMAYNKDLDKDKIIRYKVVGLENLDKESKDYRRFKQIIERLNRSYKFHTSPGPGLKHLKVLSALQSYSLPSTTSCEHIHPWKVMCLFHLNA